ncbi:unnamed protein product [Callosobruchus maculatus]|uniref:Uncharacterized protein n=1 Tax=Callosobruchus maculatus TaxID=64391 RepID=A0A653CL43_CALMS|nr:unnamed protein product [Callosobruchus maculatus]
MLSIWIILLINMLPSELNAKCLTHLTKEKVDDTFSDRMSYETPQMRTVGVTTTCTNVTLPLERFVEHLCEDCTREMKISASNIPTLQRTSFHGIRDLDILRLNGTNTRYVDPGTFEDMNKLQELYITDNNIQKIFNNSFNPLPKLKTLDLSHNALIDFESQFLDGNLNLMYLNISSNQLSSLSFKHSIKLESIDVRNNVIKTINFENITANFGYFSYNRLRQIEGCTLKVQNLDLSYNNMSTLPSLDKKCSKPEFEVVVLKLSHNVLTELNSNFFQAFPKLTSLNVSNNMIAHLSVTMFQYFPGMNNLDMSYNMLSEFDASIFDFSAKLTHVNVSYNKITFVDNKIVTNHLQRSIDLRIQCNIIQFDMLIRLIGILPPKTNLYIDILQKSFTWLELKEIREAAIKANITIKDIPNRCDNEVTRNDIIESSNATAKVDHKSVLGNITKFINNVTNSSKTLETALEHSYVVYHDSVHATDDKIHELLEQLDKSIHGVIDKMQSENYSEALGNDVEENDNSGLLKAVIVLLVFVIVLISILITQRYARRWSDFIQRGEENIELLDNNRI